MYNFAHQQYESFEKFRIYFLFIIPIYKDLKKFLYILMKALKTSFYRSRIKFYLFFTNLNRSKKVTIGKLTVLSKSQEMWRG